MNTSRAVIVALLAALLAGSGGAAAAPAPIVTVTRHGGLCVTGSECRSTLGISDATIFGDGYLSRRLKASERTALLQAIGRLDVGYLRAHPFAGTCPTAYDGSESIYRFRGFPRTLASCTTDLRGVEAVRLTERLLATLRPSPKAARTSQSKQRRVRPASDDSGKVLGAGEGPAT